MKYGYARVSTPDQCLNLQLDALRLYGVDHICEEKISGKNKNKPVLDALIAKLKTGDQLIVWKLDRLGRRTCELIKLQEALEKKRQREQKKAAKAQAIISGALTIANAFATVPFIPVGLAMGALATGLVAVQIAKINSTQYADGGLLNGKSHKQGGIPVGNTGIEVEGNEYVVNKKSTEKNLPLIEYINSNRRTLTRDDLVTFFDNGKQSLVNKKVRAKYADGGQLPEIGEIDVKSLINYEPEPDNRPIVVSVVDIINATENVRNVQSVAGL